MKGENIIKKLNDSGLTGRGGGCFPTGKKWQIVKETKSAEKYVICNGSEGEPGVLKDYHILSNFSEEVINGIKSAIDFLSAKEAFIYLKPKYLKELDPKLKKHSEEKIKIVTKPSQAGYIGGEETAVINALEGKRIEPRLRPPFPTTNGYQGKPTLINNVETFYCVSQILDGKYDRKRFYTINGDCLGTGVFVYNESETIEDILRETNNYPKFDFFVQVGGDGSGEVLNSKQLKREVGGSGSITVMSLIKHQPLELIKKWVEFFTHESCGQCTPCREGTYRIREILSEKKPNWEMVAQILDTLRDTSFCGLGCAVPIPIRSYVENILSEYSGADIKLPAGIRSYLCECFR
jgi:NADH:ubiquinone oxidoreductase subunit F (NADH-binding)